MEGFCHTILDMEMSKEQYSIESIENWKDKQLIINGYKVHFYDVVSNIRHDYNLIIKNIKGVKIIT